MTLRTPAFPFQDAEHAAHRADPAWGYCWDPGTGKTRAALADACWLEAEGRIDGMLVCAPNGVHLQWARDEVPKHVPYGLLERTEVLCWRTASAATKRDREALARFEGPLRGPTQWRRFRILIVSYDGLMTEPCVKAVRRFLESGPKMLVYDESHLLKTPGAKRTIRARAMAARAPYRRLLTGTLVVDKPFDVYSQIALLDPQAWARIGCGSAEAFRTTFGIFEQRQITDRQGRSRLYPELKGYRNLEQLHAVVAANVSRIRKEDVLGDLPAKLYSRRYFEMMPAQRRAYEEIRDEAIALLDDGAVATAPLVITRLQRMQQITSGWIPSDDFGEESRLVDLCDGRNPRLALLEETVEGLDHQLIVWAKYRRDVDLIVERLAAMGRTSARYDGSVTADEGARNLEAFRAGDAQVLVSTPAKGGTGLTLNQAKTAIWYSVGHKLGDRLQGEDRNHRIGQDVPVSIIDIVALLGPDRPSIDQGILESLSRKRDWAAVVQGDEIRGWLR